MHEKLSIQQQMSSSSSSENVPSSVRLSTRLKRRRDPSHSNVMVKINFSVMIQKDFHSASQAFAKCELYRYTRFA